MEIKKVLLILLLVFVVMQMIPPPGNTSLQVQQSDMITFYRVPAKVESVLKKSCYDCHSNNTRYPWYAKIQPLGWILAMHIKDGKAELNFNDFATYSSRRQRSKLKSIQNSIVDGTMPLSSYTLLHRDAILSKESKALLIDWASKTVDSLSRVK